MIERSSTSMKPRFNRMAVVGVGLIGASISKICKDKGIAREVVGIGRGIENLKAAYKLGAVDRFTKDLKDGVSGADIVVLATPVGSFESIAKDITSDLGRDTIVTDVGSVKGRLVFQMEEILGRGIRFVGAHPIAGSEKTGASCLSTDLFKGAKCIITPTGSTDREALEMVRMIWEEAGAKVLLLDPDTHDRILSVSSHLAHMVAYSLVNTLIDLSGDEGEVLSYTAGGFRDFTRIAGSSPEMWRDICLYNGKNIVTAIESFSMTMERLKDFINNQDWERLLKEFARAQDARKMIPDLNKKGLDAEPDC